MEALGISPQFSPFGQAMQIGLLLFSIMVPMTIVGVIVARWIYARSDPPVREKRKNTSE